MNKRNGLDEINLMFKELLADAKNKCAYLSDVAVSKTKKTFLSNGSVFCFFPYENEVYGLKSGVIINDEGHDYQIIKKNYVDGSGSILMVEDLINGGKINSKTIYNVYDSYKERFIFYKAGSFRLKSYARAELQNGIVRKVFNKGVLGESIWKFIYINENVNKIEIKEKQNGELDFSERSLCFYYDEGNILQKIVEFFSNGDKQDIYIN